MRAVYKFLLDHFRELGETEFWVKPTSALAVIILIIFIDWLSHFLTRKILLRIVSRIAKRTKTDWDDILVKNKVFKGLAHLVPAFILYHTADFSYPILHQELSELKPEMILELSQDYYFSLAGFLIKISKIYFTLIIVFVANAILNAALEIYNTTEYSHHRPIKGYIQLVKIIVFFMAGIMIIAALLNRNPTVLLTGLGAMAAVLLLVAIISAIALTMRKRPNTRFQNPSDQVQVKKADRLKIVKMDAEDKQS